MTVEVPGRGCECGDEIECRCECDQEHEQEHEKDAKHDEPCVDRYKEFTYKWNDPDVELVCDHFSNEELILLLEGAIIAGLGLFLMCSPTSGLISQVIGSLVFLSGIVVITL